MRLLESYSVDVVIRFVVFGPPPEATGAGRLVTLSSLILLCS